MNSDVAIRSTLFLCFGGSLGYVFGAGHGAAIGLAITSGICTLINFLP